MNYHARRFDRAAESYASHAAFQARMAERLLAQLPSGEGPCAALPAGALPNAAGALPNGALPIGARTSRPPESGPFIEFGCGTGQLTALLVRRFPQAALLATDAAPRMIMQAERALEARAGVRFAVCDASGAIPAPEPVAAQGPYILAASNALVQWFPDLARHLRWASALLAPGGWYLASGFDRDNFPELNSILREAPFGYADFPGHRAGDLARLAAEAGLELCALETERREEVFPTPRAFLEGIRALGAARRPRDDAPLTRARLELLLRTYQERYPRGGGVAATWAPWYAVFRKPARA